MCRRGLLLFSLISLLWASSAQAQSTTVVCNGDITASLNAAISAATTGATVNIGAGSCTMSPITLNDKNITIMGAGKGQTKITANSGLGTINVSGANVPTFRISGISFSGTGSAFLAIWGNHSGAFRGPFRIDNLSVNYPNSSAEGLIQIWGPIYGLIDHNDFTMLSEAVILTSLETDTENCSYNVGGPCDISTLGGAAGLALPYYPGGASNLYIEDNTFTGLGPIGTSPLDTAYRGGRIVFRHNTVTNGFLYAHWTSYGSVNSLWWEIYNNKFTWTLGPSSGMYPMRMQGGGTGLIYNNTFVGYPSNYIVVGEGRGLFEQQSGPPLGFCDGTHAWDGNAGDPGAAGWPCLAQTGRDAGKSIDQILAGDKPGSFPLYVWNNGPQDACYNPAAGGACDNSFTVHTLEPHYIQITAHNTTSGFGNGDVDYSITTSQPAGAGTHTLTYTPYTYPHPLVSGTPPPPPPPPPTTFTIAVSTSPSAGGTITGGGTFAGGSSDTVTATANSGYTFVNWTENGSVVSTSASYTFTLSGNVTLVANFSTCRGHGRHRC